LPWLAEGVLMAREWGTGDMTDLDGVVVRPAESGRAFRDFVALPYTLHAANPAFVPPLRIQQREALDVRKHPFWEYASRKLFVAYRGGRPVGRIAAIDNPVHNETFGEKAAHFGFFECIDDDDVAAALFAEVERFARALGRDVIRGPFNASAATGEIGLQIDGFDVPNYVMIPYSAPWYRGLLEGQGYAKDVDLYCYMIDRANAPDWLMNRCDRIVETSRYRFRKVGKAEVQREAGRIWQVYNSAWEKNWLWTKSTRAEFMHLVKELVQIADFDMVWIAETAEGEIIGFAIAIPNVNEAIIKVRDGRLLPFGLPKLLWGLRPGAVRTRRVLAMGVLEPYRKKGIHWSLIYKLAVECLRKGITQAEMSQILETNTDMVKVAEFAGGWRSKTHRMYMKRLTLSGA
jgi:GNAT superfamily N-acetyltransferase